MTSTLSTNSPFVVPGTPTSCCTNSKNMDICPPCDDSIPSSASFPLSLSSDPHPISRQYEDEDEDEDDHAKSKGNSRSSEILPMDRLASVNKFTLNPNEPRRDMQELVHALMEALEDGKKDVERLYNIMMSYDYTGNEWKRYEFFDHNKKYTRNLIASVPGCFCLMLLCWNGEKGSPIHNHAGSECMMRILQGKVVETQYIVRNGEGDQSAKCNWNKMTCSNIPPSDLIKSNENIYTEGGCAYINDSLGVHKVENPYKEPAITLHCYIPGYDTCKSWSEDTSATDPTKAIKVQQCTISYDTEQGEKPNH